MDDRERASYRPSRLPASESEAPPSAGHYDQEFLYHLYRGSELLQDNAVDEAKAELERALKLQPKDIEGQGLLGVVYFRLGLYPRAIEIYEQLRRVAPTEVAPRINLGLCYLKTGQTEQAHEILQSVIERDPDHARAWGYLGLVYQRFGDFAKAQIAFERAGRPKMAERMAALADSAHADLEIAELGAHAAHSQPPPASFRPSLMPQLPKAQPVPRLAGVSTIPPASTVVSDGLAVPTRAHQFTRDHELVFPERPRMVVHPSGSVLVRVSGSVRVRHDWITTISHDRTPLVTVNLERRSGAVPGRAAPRSDASPLVCLRGNGRMILTPKPGTHLFLLELDAEPLHLVERVVVAFEAGVDYETVALDPVREDAEAVLCLSGSGLSVCASREPIRSVEVRGDRPLLCYAGQVVGWVGRLTARMLPRLEAPAGVDGLIGFNGQGSVLLDVGARRELPGVHVS